MTFIGTLYTSTDFREYYLTSKWKSLSLLTVIFFTVSVFIVCSDTVSDYLGLANETSHIIILTNSKAIFYSVAQIYVHSLGVK